VRLAAGCDANVAGAHRVGEISRCEAIVGVRRGIDREAICQADDCNMRELAWLRDEGEGAVGLGGERARRGESQGEQRKVSHDFAILRIVRGDCNGSARDISQKRSLAKSHFV
jgi:hypothetical protein